MHREPRLHAWWRSLTAQMINRFQNLDFTFSNWFEFHDGFNGEEGYYNSKGRKVASHRTWESNFFHLR
jgi:hypothetical protein